MKAAKQPTLLILGAGESGLGAALLAKQLGYPVLVSDAGELSAAARRELEEHAIAWEEGGHSQQALAQAELAIKSPGIPPWAEPVQQLVSRGVEILSEIEFGYRHCPHRNLVAITGTNGKTTTCQLTYQILREAGFNVAVGGNIGVSFCRLLAQSPHDWYVLEVSSFQLENCYHFRPKVAAILNIYENHLNRYAGDVHAYARAKFRITQNQTEEDHLVAFLDSPLLVQHLAKHAVRAQLHLYSRSFHPTVVAWATANSIFLMSQYSQSVSRKNGKKQAQRIPLENEALRREVNRQNTMAASIVSDVLNVRKEHIRKVFSVFENEEHRLETYFEIEGVTFVNDSKASNVNAVWYALSELQGPLIWIAGGVDKGNDYSMLWPLVSNRDLIKGLVTLGQDGRLIQQAFSSLDLKMEHADTMDEAVALAFKWAQKGEKVVLSPAMASFDLFSDYKVRGDAFKAAVRRIKRNLESTQEAKENENK